MGAGKEITPYCLSVKAFGHMVDDLHKAHWVWIVMHEEVFRNPHATACRHQAVVELCPMSGNCRSGSSFFRSFSKIESR